MSLVEQPLSFGQSVTAGDWLTELESASALDERLAACQLFVGYEEIAGVLVAPRPDQVNKTVRIDRVLLPTRRLREAGWGLGAIGIEIKRSGEKIGPPLAQAMDYVRAAWRVDGLWIQLGAVFVWPIDKQYGPLTSVLTHNRVGTAEYSPYRLLRLRLDQVVLDVTDPFVFRVAEYGSGTKVGAR
jgi:hypothetical protein